MDPAIAKQLREHQVTGCKFLLDAVLGKNELGRGSLLADDMGLGKTLQTLSTIHTLLTQGRNGQPEACNAVVICPTSRALARPSNHARRCHAIAWVMRHRSPPSCTVVLNWENEVKKWLGANLLRVITVTSDLGKDGIAKRLKTFKAIGRALLVISYETAKNYISTMMEISYGILVCDEAHRLKNPKTELYKVRVTLLGRGSALPYTCLKRCHAVTRLGPRASPDVAYASAPPSLGASARASRSHLLCPVQALYPLKTAMRIMVTGTPVQNALGEFHALIDFAVPKCLGDPKAFSNRFGKPIAAARDACATEAEAQSGQRALTQFTGLVNQIMVITAPIRGVAARTQPSAASDEDAVRSNGVRAVAKRQQGDCKISAGQARRVRLLHPD